MFEAIVAGLTLCAVLAALIFTRWGTPQIFLIAALVFLASGLVDSGAFWAESGQPGACYSDPVDALCCGA